MRAKSRIASPPTESCLLRTRETSTILKYRSRVRVKAVRCFLVCRWSWFVDVCTCFWGAWACGAFVWYASYVVTITEMWDREEDGGSPLPIQISIRMSLAQLCCALGAAFTMPVQACNSGWRRCRKSCLIARDRGFLLFNKNACSFIFIVQDSFCSALSKANVRIVLIQFYW